MENEILKDIANYAAQKLNQAYGYCGVAEGTESIFINSDDKNGNEIKIIFKLVAE